MTISRRRLLAFTALAPLAACAPGVTLTPQDVLTNASAVVNGLSSALKIVAPTLPPAITAQASQWASYLALATTALDALSASTPAQQGASLVVTIEGYVNQVLAAATTSLIAALIPPPFSTALGAVAIVLPFLETFANQYVRTAAASPATAAARLTARGMAPAISTQAQAVAMLQGLVTK